MVVTINNKSANPGPNSPPHGNLGSTHGKMLSTTTSQISNNKAPGKFGDADIYDPGATLQADHHSPRGVRHEPVRLSKTSEGSGMPHHGNHKLKMQDVRNLSDDADQVIDSLKGVDYGMQELDVLIELARQLKAKREAMFPDTTSIL